jgi:hypothetical protein
VARPYAAAAANHPGFSRQTCPGICHDSGTGTDAHALIATLIICKHASARRRHKEFCTICQGNRVFLCLCNRLWFNRLLTSNVKKSFDGLIKLVGGLPQNMTGLPALLHHEYLDITFSHLIQHNSILITVADISVVILLMSWSRGRIWRLPVYPSHLLSRWLCRPSSSLLGCPVSIGETRVSWRSPRPRIWGPPSRDSMWPIGINRGSVTFHNRDGGSSASPAHGLRITVLKVLLASLASLWPRPSEEEEEVFRIQ